MLLGQVLRTLLQAIYFVLIARSLGADGYGAFVGVCALVAILSPFVGLGRGDLLIKHVARNPENFSGYWGKALIVTLISGSILLIVALGVSSLFFPANIPSSLVFVVAVADLFFGRVLDITGQAFQAFHRLEKTALILIVPNVLRTVAIAVLSISVQAATPLQWGYLYLMTSGISALIGMWLVHHELGVPVFTLSGLKAELTEGLYFSVSLSATGIYNDIDKAMLTRFSTLDATGIYSAAYRIIDVSFTPIRSLLNATYASFFKHGEAGVRGSLGFARTLFPIAGGYGLISGLLLILAAPLLPYVLGAEYSDTASALRWLAPLPFMKAVHYFAADTLTGAGFQGIRTAIQVGLAFFNVGINLWLIPAYSWRGAAWASIVSDGLLALLMCLVLVHVIKKSRLSEKRDLIP